MSKTRIMKADELRIGNYYQTTDAICSYSRITADDIKAFSLGAVYGKPIPLTEEILLKCGFKEEYFKRFKFNKFEFNILSCVLLFYTINNQCLVLKNIKYLHQLQNLYFALTGTELCLKQES